MEELVRVLTSFGYQECASQKFEKGVQKVAIFARDGIPVHVAIQPSNRSGIWKSKMGYNIDMEHELRAIETHADDDPQKQGYGKLAKIMSKTSARKAK